MQTVAHDCPNCSAPLKVPLGEVETGCEYCGSRLKLLPGESELAVVRTREEMKRRERVEVQRLILEQKLRQEELARWRETAGKVAIAKPLLSCGRRRVAAQEVQPRESGHPARAAG